MSCSIGINFTASPQILSLEQRATVHLCEGAADSLKPIGHWLHQSVIGPTNAFGVLETQI